MGTIEKRMKRRHPIATGVALGIVSSGTLMQTHNYVGDYASRSDRDRMRSDWQRVGGDFNKVMAAENAKAAARTR